MLARHRVRCRTDTRTAMRRNPLCDLPERQGTCESNPGKIHPVLPVCRESSFSNFQILLIGKITTDTRAGQIANIVRVYANRLTGNGRCDVEVAEIFWVAPNDALAALL